MVFGCISKNFPENIFWCLEKKKENTNQKMQNNTNQKNTSHKSRKTQLQNNTRKLRLVHSNIFTKNASNQAKETKTQQKKMNHRSWEKRELRSERCDHPDDEWWRAMRSHQTKTRADDRCDLIDRTARSHRSRSSIAPLIGAVRLSDEQRDRRSVLSDLSSLFSHSLSDLGSLFSLSLSLSFRKWIEVKMRV